MEKSSNISYEETGTLKTDMFYEIQVMFDDEPAEAGRDRSWIVVPRSPTNLELALRGDESYCWVETSIRASDEVNELDCKINSRHVTWTYFKSISLHVNGGACLSEFLPDLNGLIVLSQEFADRIRLLPFRGMDLRPAKTTLNQGPLRDPRFVSLQFSGRCRLRTPKVEHAANACPFCGEAPMICQECGCQPWECVKCGKPGRIAVHLHKGADDKRLKVLIPNGYFQRGQVLEGKYWDGSDLVSINPGSNFISKRVLDWLLMVHAAPFYVKPARFCIDGMSDKQLSRLEEIEKPLE